jgi:hypothetical protein
MITLQDVRDYFAKTKSPVQLVKHYDEVLQKNLKWPAWAEQKEDGVWCGVVRAHKEFGFFSRTGNEFYSQLSGLELQTPLLGGQDGMYITELVNPVLSLEELSGLVNTNRKASWTMYERDAMDKCQLRFHDYIPLGDLLSGRSYMSHADRVSWLMVNVPHGVVIPGTLVHTDEQWRAFACR